MKQPNSQNKVTWVVTRSSYSGVGLANHQMEQLNIKWNWQMLNWTDKHWMEQPNVKWNRQTRNGTAKSQMELPVVMTTTMSSIQTLFLAQNCACTAALFLVTFYFFKKKLECFLIFKFLNQALKVFYFGIWTHFFASMYLESSSKHCQVFISYNEKSLLCMWSVCTCDDVVDTSRFQNKTLQHRKKDKCRRQCTRKLFIWQCQVMTSLTVGIATFCDTRPHGRDSRKNMRGSPKV